ncbi:MAG: mannose-1-phosphate guanylyltransferase [Flavobacteriaceae bacterium]|nr:mannose-1-phosphate guanylyltransferase [Flavobacteriaceae bacterium]
MKNENYYAVIMAGGIGSRFWPVSTTDNPKQFHDMLGTGKSLLQKTFSRLASFIPESQIYVLTNDRYLDLTLEQLPEITEDQVVLEPAMRNTAPCILMAALKIQKENPDAVMLVAPSDHWIEDEEAFAEDVKICFKGAAEDDKLVTLGIRPTFPNTGYGYIETTTDEDAALKPVRQFREKPDYETAKTFLAAGNFLWNAGIFIWSVRSIVTAFQNFLPTMYSLFEEGKTYYNTAEEEKFVTTHYERSENISIDYGIMEKASNVYVRPANFDWNDLGTWGALHDKMTSAESDNAVVRAQSHLKDASGNMIYTSKEKLVIVDGLNDYIIVDKDDTLLIFPKKKEQDIKQLRSDIAEVFGPEFT